ncbi:MAG: hypothetical protein ACJ8F1_22185, partial [Polyangia bacterium]
MRARHPVLSLVALGFASALGAGCGGGSKCCLVPGTGGAATATGGAATGGAATGGTSPAGGHGGATAATGGSTGA